jgi:hypothetical protein
MYRLYPRKEILKIDPLKAENRVSTTEKERGLQHHPDTVRD